MQQRLEERPGTGRSIEGSRSSCQWGGSPGEVEAMITGKSRRCCARSWVAGRQRARGEKERAVSGVSAGRMRTGVEGSSNNITQQMEVGARLHTPKV